MLVGRDDERDAARDPDAEPGQAVQLARVVGHEADGAHLEQLQHVGGDAVVALVVAEAQGEIGVHRVQALVLQAVGGQSRCE